MSQLIPFKIERTVASRSIVRGSGVKLDDMAIACFLPIE